MRDGGFFGPGLRVLLDQPYKAKPYIEFYATSPRRLLNVLSMLGPDPYGQLPRITPGGGLHVSREFYAYPGCGPFKVRDRYAYRWDRNGD